MTPDSWTDLYMIHIIVVYHAKSVLAFWCTFLDCDLLWSHVAIVGRDEGGGGVRLM